MADIAPLGRTFAPPAAGPSRVNGSARPAAAAPRAADQADLSDQSRWLSKLADLPAVRQDLVDRIKTEIELDQYDAPEKLDAKVDAALDGLLASGDLEA
jgi:hypothetical protein